MLPQLDRFAAAAIREVAEREEREVVVAGNSLGGCVSMRAAERAELPLAGIVPIAPAGLDMAQWFTIIETIPIVRALLRAPVPLPETVVREAVGRAYRSVAFTRPSAVDPTAVASFTRHLADRRDVIRLLATGRRLKPELQDEACFRLGRIACPVLLVWGDADKMVYPSGSERVLREVADVRYEVIPNCGHCPQVERARRARGACSTGSRSVRMSPVTPGRQRRRLSAGRGARPGARRRRDGRVGRRAPGAQGEAAPERARELRPADLRERARGRRGARLRGRARGQDPPPRGRAQAGHVPRT